MGFERIEINIREMTQKSFTQLLGIGVNMTLCG